MFYGEKRLIAFGALREPEGTSFTRIKGRDIWRLFASTLVHRDLVDAGIGVVLTAAVCLLNS